jgi:hypothetical protein
MIFHKIVHNEVKSWDQEILRFAQMTDSLLEKKGKSWRFTQQIANSFP